MTLFGLLLAVVWIAIGWALFDKWKQKRNPPLTKEDLKPLRDALSDLDEILHDHNWYKPKPRTHVRPSHTKLP